MCLNRAGVMDGVNTMGQCWCDWTDLERLGSWCEWIELVQLD